MLYIFSFTFTNTIISQFPNDPSHSDEMGWILTTEDIVDNKTIYTKPINGILIEWFQSYGFIVQLLAVVMVFFY